MPIEQTIEALSAELRLLNTNFAAFFAATVGAAAVEETGEAAPATGPNGERLKKDGTPAKKTGPTNGLKNPPNPAAAANAPPLTDLQAGAQAAIGTAGDPSRYTYEGDIKPALSKLSAECGREELTALLQRFGVAKAPDLKQGQYPEIYRLANEIIAKKLSARDRVDEEVDNDSLV